MTSTSKAIKPALSLNPRLQALSRHLAQAGDMEGKVIAITGAASGIGLALAEILALRGAKISLADAHQTNLYRAAQELLEFVKSPDHIWAQRVDVRSPAQLSAWMAQTLAKFGRLDGAANLAGIVDSFDPGRVWHEEDEDESQKNDSHGEAQWDRVVATNLFGVANSMKAELKVLENGGAIVNAASVAGLSGKAGTVAYVASKHGVVGLTKSIARRYGPGRGIRVNAVAPGTIDTPMLKGVEDQPGLKESSELMVKQLPLARKGEVHEAAKVFAFLLSDDASYVTGSVYTVDGGMTA